MRRSAAAVWHGLPDRQLLFRRARCAEKLPQLQSAVGAAAPAVSGRLVQEVSALGERCSNIAQETKSQLDKVMHTCQPGWPAQSNALTGCRSGEQAGF